MKGKVVLAMRAPEEKPETKDQIIGRQVARIRELEEQVAWLEYELEKAKQCYIFSAD